MKQRQFRWTWTDTLITGLIVIFSIIFVQKVQMAKQLEMPEEQMHVTLVAEKQFLFFKDTVQVGDPIYQKGSEVPFGTIVDVQEKPAKHLTLDQDGNYYERHLRGLVDIYITVESTGFRSLFDHPVIDQTFFHLNQYLPVETNRVQFPTRVIDIR